MTIESLLRESIVIDMHLDLLMDVERKRRGGRMWVLRDDYLESFRVGGVTAVVASLYVEEGDEEDATRHAMNQVAALYAELEECPEFVQVFTAAGIRSAKREGKIGIMLSFEGAEPMAGNPEALRVFYALGVRILGVCWSRSNWAGDGSRFSDPAYVGYGLTKSGKAMLRIAEELGMLIDVSHMNERTVADTLAFSTGPLLASHSNTRRHADTPRNLSDEQITAIGKRGGIIGVNGVRLIADVENPGTADLYTLARHMSHIKGLIGAQHLCLGLDQCDRLPLPMTDGAAAELQDLIPTHALLPEFCAVLRDCGFTDRELTGILGENALRVMEQVL